MPEHRDIDRARKLLKRWRGSTDSLIGGRRALRIGTKDDQAFLRAMQEAFSRHFLACPGYRELCRRRGFVPHHLRRLEHLPDIPYLFVTVIEHHRLLSVREEKIRLTLRAPFPAGATGQRSAIHLDGLSLRRIRTIVKHIYGELGMTSPRRTNYLCFSYDPEGAADLATAFSDELLTSLTRVHEVFHAIRWSEHSSDWRVDVESCLERLNHYEKSGRPLRVLGFPAHAWEVLEECVRRQGRAFRFNSFSYVMAGGGWKTLRGDEIPKAEFRATLSRWLGIPPSNVRDVYGMVEHGIPYCECEMGKMHVSRLSRVYVRDPETLEVLPWGQSGVLQLLTPYLSSVPAISLLSTDVGHLEPDCTCGRKSPVLVLHSRDGASKQRIDALAALDVRRKSG